MRRLRLLAQGVTMVTMALGVVAGAITAEAQRNPNLPEANAEAIYGRITDQYGRPLRARVELWYPESERASHAGVGAGRHRGSKL